jgi:hypothetical protein
MGGIYPLSDIRANTISDTSGNGPINLHKQSASKVWVNFNGLTITNPSDMTGVRGSLNVSGVKDVGKGDYIVNFSSSFSAVDYTGTTGVSFDSPTSGVLDFNRACGASGYSTTSSFRMASVVVDSTTNRLALDVDHLYATFHGDLA